MNKPHYFFKGRKLLIATQHKKKNVIRLLLENELQVQYTYQ
jgi:hypothetical protein